MMDMETIDNVLWITTRHWRGSYEAFLAETEAIEGIGSRDILAIHAKADQIAAIAKATH